MKWKIKTIEGIVMKKGIILNSEISGVIATMGHTDSLVIADCGLPIPNSTKRIDIALTKNVPSFIETLVVVLSELQVEEAIIANEMIEKSPELYQSLKNTLGDIPIVIVSHEDFKVTTSNAKACIRTGECTPYANIILKSGVTF